MYPFVRLAWITAMAPRRKQLAPGEVGELSLTAWPWDCDVFLELNNGRQLTLFDLGRFDLAMRNGLMKIVRERKWGFVVGGASVQFRKRIFPFDRFILRTEIAGWDEKWFYFLQTTLKGDAPCSQALVRAAVIAGRQGTVPTADVAAALGLPEAPQPPPEWIQAWSDAERQRPWPPRPAA